MVSAVNFFPGRLSALVVLGVPVSFLSFCVAAGVTSMPVLAALVVPVVAVSLWGVDVLARRVARQLRSDRLPWGMWASVTGAVWVAVASVVEINVLFAGNDSSHEPGLIVR